MNPLVCDGCIYHHPGRQEKKCSCLPRAVPEEMKKCSVRLEAPSDATMAMRVVTGADIEKESKQKGR